MRDGVHHRLAQHAGRIGRNLGALPGAQLRVARQVFVEKRLGTADLLGQRTADGLALEGVAHRRALKARAEDLRPTHPALRLAPEEQQACVRGLKVRAAAHHAAPTHQQPKRIRLAERVGVGAHFSQVEVVERGLRWAEAFPRALPRCSMS